MPSPEKSKDQIIADLLAFKDAVKKLLKTPRLSHSSLKIRLARALRDVEKPEATIIQTGPGDETLRIIRKLRGEDKPDND